MLLRPHFSLFPVQYQISGVTKLVGIFQSSSLASRRGDGMVSESGEGRIGGQSVSPLQSRAEQGVQYWKKKERKRIVRQPTDRVSRLPSRRRRRGDSKSPPTRRLQDGTTLIVNKSAYAWAATGKKEREREREREREEQAKSVRLRNALQGETSVGLSTATQGLGWLQSKAEKADSPFGFAEYSIRCL